MHAHMESRSRDCDGDYTAGQIHQMTFAEQEDPFGEITFKDRVVTNIIFLHDHGTLTVTPEGVSWHEKTEEGYRAAEVQWCNDECPQGQTWQRDHRAEEAGY